MEKTRKRRAVSEQQCPFCKFFPVTESSDAELNRHILRHCFKKSNGELMEKPTKNFSTLTNLQCKIGNKNRTQGTVIVAEERRKGTLLQNKEETSMHQGQFEIWVISEHGSKLLKTPKVYFTK